MAAELTPGTWFRGLQIRSLLGQGAMGAAYLAAHPVLRTPLILKTFTAAPGDDLFREAHLAARVASPWVVGVIDAGVENGVPFVVQRYVDGIDLQELLDRLLQARRALPIDTVIRVIIDVAHALHAVHQAGVVHRDVKPANLFLSGEGRALVGDFGIAVDPGKATAATMQTAGTPIFMAPEMWRGQIPDTRSDVYALGATAHLLATGVAPYPLETNQDLAKAHMSTPYIPPMTTDPAAAFLFSVIARTLAKNPDERFTSSEEVAKSLRRVADEPPGYRVIATHGAAVGQITVTLARGDISMMEGDVLVNAANWQLRMETGVAAAMRFNGGEEIQAEALRYAPVRMGDVVWTGAGRLRARWVAHAVAALEGAVCIQRCVLRVLLDADSHGAGSVIFPALGTGVGQVPAALAAKLTLEAIRTFASLGPKNIRRVGICLYDDESLGRWRQVLQTIG